MLIPNIVLNAYNAKTGAVTAQLMSATKPIRTFNPSPVPVRFLASGLNNDLFVHICVNEGADQLRGNHTAQCQYR